MVREGGVLRFAIILPALHFWFARASQPMSAHRGRVHAWDVCTRRPPLSQKGLGPSSPFTEQSLFVCQGAEEEHRDLESFQQGANLAFSQHQEKMQIEFHIYF